MTSTVVDGRDRLLDAAVILVGRGTTADYELALRVLGAGPSPALLTELHRLHRFPPGERREALASVLVRVESGVPVVPVVPFVPRVRRARRGVVARLFAAVTGRG